MIRDLLTSIRLRLLLLVLLALGLTLYVGLEHRRMAGVQAQQEALRLVRIASSDYERFTVRLPLGPRMGLA